VTSASAHVGQTLPEVATVVRSVIASRLPRACGGGRILVERDRGAFLVKCSLDGVPLLGGGDTAVEFRMDPADAEVWICDLRVAPSRRGRGIGRRLAQVVETAAYRLGARSVRLLPLHGTQAFWRALGYEPVDSPAHAHGKRVEPDTENGRNGG